MIACGTSASVPRPAKDVDIVYVVGPGEQNHELRFSLRSLRNLPHDKVWIAGHIPKWVVGVGRIPTVQKGSKWANAYGNIKAACLHPEVAEEFVYFNDDFFVLRPIDAMPVYHRGPLRPLVDLQRRKRVGESYAGGRAGTYRLLASLGYANPIAYEPIHVPMPFQKAKLLETLGAGADVPALHYRTLYGNQHAIGGQPYPNVKISDTQKRPSQDWGFVSTSARSFDRGRVGQMLRALFPDPSPYEDPNEPYQHQPVRRAGRNRVRRVQPRNRRRAGAGVPR